MGWYWGNEETLKIFDSSVKYNEMVYLLIFICRQSWSSWCRGRGTREAERTAEEAMFWQSGLHCVKSYQWSEKPLKAVSLPGAEQEGEGRGT